MSISNQAKLRDGKPTVVTGISPTLFKDLVANLKEKGGRYAQFRAPKNTIGHSRSTDPTTLLREPRPSPGQCFLPPGSPLHQES